MSQIGHGKAVAPRHLCADLGRAITSGRLCACGTRPVGRGRTGPRTPIARSGVISPSGAVLGGDEPRATCLQPVPSELWSWLQMHRMARSRVICRPRGSNRELNRRPALRRVTMVINDARRPSERSPFALRGASAPETFMFERRLVRRVWLGRRLRRRGRAGRRGCGRGRRRRRRC